MAEEITSVTNYRNVITRDEIIKSFAAKIPEKAREKAIIRFIDNDQNYIDMQDVDLVIIASW